MTLSYLSSHIPKVKEIWGPHGMTGCKVVKHAPGPDGQAGPYQITCIITFNDMASMGAAMADKGTQYLTEDPKNYTDESSAKSIFLVGEDVAST